MHRRAERRGTEESADQEPGRRVFISARLAHALLAYLSEGGERERGGVLLGQRDVVNIQISSAIFPPQLTRNRVACSFDVRCLDVINTARTSLDDDLKRESGQSSAGYTAILG